MKLIYKMIFDDFPDFKPNLTPQEIFDLGSFGGTYFRPIYSSVTEKKYENIHKNYKYLNDIPSEKLTSSIYNKKINKYKVEVGTSLDMWEEKGWINECHPYGWVHWYCDFYNGKRCYDDKRQIERWKNLAGVNGRFRKMLISLIKKKDGKYDDFSISPKIRQTLQHWGYVLTEADFKVN